jgi:hypothetical protein
MASFKSVISPHVASSSVVRQLRSRISSTTSIGYSVRLVRCCPLPTCAGPMRYIVQSPATWK